MYLNFWVKPKKMGIDYCLIENPLLRDLAWALSSPGLISRNTPKCIWQNDLFFAQQWELFQPLFAELKSDATPLMNYMATIKDQRYGHYFESLWAFWLARHPKYELIGQQIPIRNSIQTLGEFDFILRDRQTGEGIHLEVAIKFYLKHGSNKHMYDWVGTRHNDTLGRKISHMEDHQLHLSKHDLALKWATEHNIKIDHKWAIAKGRLFFPYDKSTWNSDGFFEMNPSCEKGWWIADQDFLHMDMPKNRTWSVMPYDKKMAPMHIDEIEQMYSWNGLVKRLNDHVELKAIPLISWANGKEHERFYIMPQSWINNKS